MSEKKGNNYMVEGLHYHPRFHILITFTYMHRSYVYRSYVAAAKTRYFLFENIEAIFVGE